MRFIYAKNAGQKQIILDSKQSHHLFIVRRLKAKRGEIFHFANLVDSALYRYEFAESNGKNAVFNLLDSANVAQKSPKTHIIQAIIADFDKVLPTLNELFVEKITLFYADFSQKNIRINLERLNAILINSSMQCGRLQKMEIEILTSLDEVLEKYSNALALDFCNNSQNLRDFERFIIGCEGGFSERERELFKNRRICVSGINHPLILRAQSASIFVASKKI
ncbi:16S rRNA (uracil(1498)-N(3))-methyltransferase [Helicobacter sp. 23-1045]